MLETEHALAEGTSSSLGRMDLAAHRSRFPAVVDSDTAEWARFDGPAGTQVVDSAIDAMTAWQRSGNNANLGGEFAMTKACEELVDSTRTTVARLLGADPAGLTLGPSATAMLMRLALAAAHELREGDEIVCTQIDHEANVSPWLLVARDRGAVVRFAELEPATGILSTEAVSAQLSDRTKWVAVTGASNVIGTIPDLAAVTAAAHSAGAKVIIDGVHLTPHRRVDLAAIGCDAYVTSAYKWYGPHQAALWLEPELLDALDVYKVRPALDRGPERIEWGTASFEGMAGMRAAAEYLLDVGMDQVAAHETATFTPLLRGLQAMDHVTTYGMGGTEGRTPTLYFNVHGMAPVQVAAALATERVAVWSGHNYGLGAVDALGLADSGGGVRVGVSLYTSTEDVDRLLVALAQMGPTT